MSNNHFTLSDFMDQMANVRKLGPMSKVMGMIPGMSEMLREKRIDPKDVEKATGRIRGIYHSMSVEERRNPDLLDARRLQRIADGAGAEVHEVNEFIRHFENYRAVMRRFFPPTP
jgi:signal recognition particle subunit SRP54